jgi:hypothetical protein
MKPYIKTGALIAGALILSVIGYTLIEYNGPFTITGKISSIIYIETKLNPGFTKITFDDGRIIAFSGDLMFNVGSTYAFTYHKYGLLCELLGGKSDYVMDRAAMIG